MIVCNKIQCLKCGDIIESTHRHDFKFCKCQSCAVDGGREYLRRCGRAGIEYKDLSIFEKSNSDVEEVDYGL